MRFLIILLRASVSEGVVPAKGLAVEPKGIERSSLSLDTEWLFACLLVNICMPVDYA